MSSGTTNKIVTSTVNIVSWEISRSSYEAAKKKILSLQQLTTKPAKALEPEGRLNNWQIVNRSGDKTPV